MTIAEFEEKELEGPLNNQLALGEVMWSPGQVLEKVIGIDAALMTQSVCFWSLNGFSLPPPGAIVQASWWPSVIAQKALKARPPPNFKLNAFLQYKRPEYLSGVRAAELSDWKQKPYFRFFISEHQQRALEACAQALGSNGLVAYGSPAFYQRADLFHHCEHRTLVENTHFVKVMKLKGHHRYTYKNPITKGKVHSEAKEVSPLVFNTRQGGDRNPPPVDPPPPERDGGDRPPDELLSDARRAAEAAVRASPELVGREQLFRSNVERTAGLVLNLGLNVTDRQTRALDNYVVTVTFTAMSRISWLVQ